MTLFMIPDIEINLIVIQGIDLINRLLTDYSRQIKVVVIIQFSYFLNKYICCGYSKKNHLNV